MRIIMPNSTQDQIQRRAALRRLLTNGPAATQGALVDALRSRGLAATQSSVSRDLREMGAIKTSAGYELADNAETDAEQMAGVASCWSYGQPLAPRSGLRLHSTAATGRR
jgi:transcriptional regulator of arginine metabolism